MPRVAPTLKARYGATGDAIGNITHQVGGVVVAAGDVVVVTYGSSDYLHRHQGVPYGLTGSTFQERGGAYGTSGYGNVGTWAAVAAQSGTFTISLPISGGNNGANSANVRVFVFGGSEGFSPNHVSRRIAGAANITLNTVQEASAIVFVGVDWNAANGTPVLLSGNSQDLFINGGYAEFITTWMGNSGVVGAKGMGLSSPTNWKNSVAALEIYGKYVDDVAPGSVSSIDAVPLSSSEIRVDWGAASDNIGVTAYRVYDYNTQIAEVGAAVRTFTHSGLLPESTHQYTVRALDAAGNLGGVISSKTVTTLVTAVNKSFLGVTKPSLRLGTDLVRRLYVGNDQIWP